jgi:2-dehydro-3-deoxyphosphogluconate aldolase / (4S)-4-hydroxy-2-oxoglutarate aldolase
MNRQEVRARIQEIGIVPAVRVSSSEDARFAAETVSSGGIPIVEINLTVPGAIELISELVKRNPGTIVGAGGVMDPEIALRCLDAGVSFLTSDGFDVRVVEFAIERGIVVFPGALTPTEVARAWRTGPDFVKVFPCAQVGGDSYIRALKKSFPEIPLIAAGGVNQLTALNFILSGATALGVGSELIPREAIRLRQEGRIHELARRFISFVNNGRMQAEARRDPTYPRI